MQIYFDQTESGSDQAEEYGETMEKALSVILAGEGIDEDGAEVSVSFVTPDEIRTLNSEYRGVDSVTDVLSFPQFESVDDLIDAEENTGVAELGDVVICMDRAASQAEEFGHSVKREVIYLFVHSILHLLGYDHMEEDEKKVMRAREEEVMGQLGIVRE